MEEIKFNEQEFIDKSNEKITFTSEELQKNLKTWIATFESRERQRRLIEFLNDKFKEVEKQWGVVLSVHVSAEVYAIIRTLGKDLFDEACMADITENGIYGWLWTADIIVKPDLNKEMIFSTEKYVKEK